MTPLPKQLAHDYGTNLSVHQFSLETKLEAVLLSQVLLKKVFYKSFLSSI